MIWTISALVKLSGTAPHRIGRNGYGCGKPHSPRFPSSILKHHFAAFLIGLLVIPLSTAGAFDPAAAEIKDRIFRGIELTIENEFEAATEIYRGLVAEYPDEPVGYFYLAAVLQSQMLDEEDYSHQTRFEDWINKCLQKAKERQKDRHVDPWLLFYEGNAYLYQSFLKSKLGNWWGAYRDARKGAGRLQEVLELDSAFYDAYLGIGSYKYWKSARMKLIRWLPFVPDEREAGIRMVKEAIDKGEYVELIGRDQLVWILLDAGRLQEAKRYARENHQRYPRSRFFLWTLVEVLYRSGEWEEAYQKYGRLLNEVRQIPNNNHYNEIECLLKMADIDYNRGNRAHADSLIGELFALQLQPEIRERARSRLERALKLKLEYSEQASQPVRGGLE